MVETLSEIETVGLVVVDEIDKLAELIGKHEADQHWQTQTPPNSDNQYAVSIKEDTSYLCLHFTKDHERNKINTPYPENPIRRIQVIECEDSEKYRTWSLLQETPNTPYRSLSIRRITSITVNGKNAYELKGKFLDDLHKNAFSGTNGEDAVEHIEYFLRIVDPIDLPNVNQDKLRVVGFPISLVGDAWKWFDEIKGSIDRALWDHWKLGSDEIEPTDEKFLNLEKNTRIDSELFTYDIERTGNYDDYMNEFNDEFEEPWDEDGVPYEIRDHICEPFRFKNGKTKWPTCSSNEDGFCNGEALKQKAIYEESWGNAKQSVINFCGWLKRTFGDFHDLDYGLLEKLQDYWWKDNDHELSPFANWRNHIQGLYVNFFATHDPHLDINRILDMNKGTSHDDEHELSDNATRERSICNIRRFEMIKYSFRDDKETRAFTKLPMLMMSSVVFDFKSALQHESSL
ncbi:hypothetical protein Tco_0150990 [Tanacetum coccineum]